MKYLKYYKESLKFSILDDRTKKLFPDFMEITTSNGTFRLKKCDHTIAPPKIYVSYNHSTPEISGDVLSDGEPDYLCIDLNFLKNEKKQEINVEITYGDAMMYEFKISKPNKIDVFVYNGYNSKFDPSYEFTFTEESINQLMELFNRFGFELTRDRLNFLDSDKSSYDARKNGGGSLS